MYEEFKLQEAVLAHGEDKPKDNFFKGIELLIKDCCKCTGDYKRLHYKLLHLTSHGIFGAHLV